MDFRESLPEVSFTDNKTAKTMMEEMIADYQEEYRRLTGEKTELSPAHPDRLKLYAAAQQLFQLLCYIDRAGKLNLLKYTYGDYLDNVAVLKRVKRNPAAYASTVLRFSMNAPREEATGIPGGTRAAAQDNMYFATSQYAEIEPGELWVDVPAVCLAAGAAGNGYPAGTVNMIVDPLPYIAEVSNIRESSGGADREGDDNLAERAYLAPAAYSVAGPSDAYRYHTLAARNDIGDVAVSSPEPTHARIVILMADGSLPSEIVLKQVEESLSGDTLRPLTDLVTVEAPEEIEYSLSFTYYVAKSCASQAVSIQAAVNQAVQGYQMWQRTIGRDINPSEVIRRVMEAGAKRIALLEPGFAPVGGDQVPKLTVCSVIYGGLEDD